jgi:hypothetical protein
MSLIYLVCFVLACFEPCFCLISTGKDQQPPEPEPSKLPKGPTASVQRDKANVVEEDGGRARQRRKVARQQAVHAHAQTSHAESDPAAVAVQLPEGAPHAIPELEAAPHVVSEPEGAPELELDYEGEDLGEANFAEDEVEVREPAVPKRRLRKFLILF